MTRGRFQRWRRIAGAAQAAVWLGLPLLRVGGESALRLDVASGRLHAFGASFALGEAHVVLLAILALTFAFLAVTLVAGRVWCGWSCPQTVLGDLTRWVEAGFPGAGAPPPSRRRRKPRRWRRPAGFAVTAATSAVVAASMVFWFVEPYGFLARLARLSLGPAEAGAWGVLSLVLFLDLAFLRADFCATACPYAKLQGVLFDRSTLVVAYDARRAADCVDCGACVRVCPTGIDIRHGLQMACIACAACVDACEPVMRRLHRAPDLVGYAYGEPGSPRRPWRPAPLALGGAGVAATAVLVAVLAGRPLLALEAMADPSFVPRRAADGRVIDAYAVAVENRGRAPMQVVLAFTAEGRTLELRPDVLDLAPGERRQLRVVASARGLAPGVHDAVLVAEAVPAASRRPPERRLRTLAFVTPAARPEVR